jgi:hypothetical protein
MTYQKMTDSKTGLPQPGLDAAREGRTINGYVNAKTGIDTAATLKDATFLTVIPIGKRIVVTCFYMYLSTVSDWATVTWGVTENSDGTGTYTGYTVQFREDTGAALAELQPALIHFDPPLAFTRDHGQAFTAYVQGNDAAAALTLGYAGWLEEE